MRFRPQELGVDESDFGERFGDLLQTNTEEILGFQSGGLPVGGRSEPTLTSSTVVQVRLLRNAFCDVDGVSQTTDTHVGAIGLDDGTAFGTENRCLRGVGVGDIVHSGRHPDWVVPMSLTVDTFEVCTQSTLNPLLWQRQLSRFKK